MAKGKYIKVELKSGKKHILLAANEAFYKKQGAKISEPTQSEIEKAFPEVKAMKQVDPEKEVKADVKTSREQLDPDPKKDPEKEVKAKK